MTTTALIVAAGRGHRMGGMIPKQYRLLGGIPVMRLTTMAFVRHPAITSVRFVIHPDDEGPFREAVKDLVPPSFVFGGRTRQESVRLGLESLALDPPQKVLVHDAVRPFVSTSIISSVVAALDLHPAAIPALPVVDTLKKVQNNMVISTVDRALLWRAQTPQGFRFDTILAAHLRFLGSDITDDSQLIEMAGLPVSVVPGSEENFKVTLEQDMERAEALLESMDRDSQSAREVR